jgi:hypothetical protein
MWGTRRFRVAGISTTKKKIDELQGAEEFVEFVGGVEVGFEVAGA